MCAPARLTVPVQCPHCRHQGPAFVHLLGKHSRCKMCNHVFRIPRNIRIACPGCGIALRVLSEAIGRNVVCKFCDQAFRVDSGLLANVTHSCPGEHPVAGTTRIRPPVDRGISEIAESLNSARAELTRIEQERISQAERIQSVEQALLRVLRDQETLKAELERFQTENNAHGWHRRLTDEAFSVSPSIHEEEQKRLKEEERAHPSELQAVATTSSLLPHYPGRSIGHGRHLLKTTRPPQKPAAPARATIKPNGARSNLCDALDEISHCELKADLLITQLKTAEEARELERGSFEKTLELLHQELSLTRSELELARGNTRL